MYVLHIVNNYSPSRPSPVSPALSLPFPCPPTVVLPPSSQILCRFRQLVNLLLLRLRLLLLNPACYKNIINETPKRSRTEQHPQQNTTLGETNYSSLSTCFMNSQHDIVHCNIIIHFMTRKH